MQIQVKKYLGPATGQVNEELPPEGSVGAWY